MTRKRTDANHALLMQTFRKLGCSIIDLSAVGKGCPDLAIGKHGKTALVEIKRDDKAKHTPAQLEFMAGWHGGTLATVRDIEGAVRLVHMMGAA